VGTAQLVAHAADKSILCVRVATRLFPNYFGISCYWRYVALVVVLASGIVVVVVGVCNQSHMRTSKCTCLIFGVSIGLDPG